MNESKVRVGEAGKKRVLLVVEVVEDRDIKPLFKEVRAEYRADIAGAAGD